jgi:hypothetical protein
MCQQRGLQVMYIRMAVQDLVCIVGTSCSPHLCILVIVRRCSGYGVCIMEGDS